MHNMLLLNLKSQFMAVKSIVSVGIGSISIDGLSLLKKMVETTQGKVSAVGNVPSELFGEGTREQFEKAVKHYIDIAAKDGSYFMCSGCPLRSTRRLKMSTGLWKL